jgi:hypothetical protein
MTDLLDLILDTLIPASPDGRLPSAGALGLAATVREKTASARAIVDAGLAMAEQRGVTELDAAERTALLREIDAAEPAFITTVYTPTCIAYYEHPDVQTGLGLEPGPPHPRGYALELGNLDGLARVRERGKLYRDT